MNKHTNDVKKRRAKRRVFFHELVMYNAVLLITYILHQQRFSTIIVSSAIFTVQSVQQQDSDRI